MLCKRCRSIHIEHNKISFAIFQFFYDFIWNLQVTAQTHKGGRFFLHTGPRKDLIFTTMPSNLTARSPSTMIPHRGALDGGGGSSTAMWGRGWATRGTWLQFGVPVLDWDTWFGRKGHLRAAAVERWWRSRGCLSSGEDRGGVEQCVARVASL
jgi:hypothetical protein